MIGQMKKLVLLTLLYMVALGASAQIKIGGSITDLQQKPVSGVIVKLMSGNKTLAFCISNSEGVYNLELKEMPRDEVSLLFSHISYESESEPVMLKGKSAKVDMVMLPKTVSLQELTVKADPLRQSGDTLKHTLASFLGKGDVTLEDGLKRLPGVDVAKSGTISYMGKPISQFNIEGLDLLGGKYNLATRNIPADYVTQVEIVRNHHARKVEKDIPSNEVSMNIRLSRKAKFKPFGQEEAGVGYMQDGRDRLQALLGVTGMLFTDKFQTISALKGGNYKDFAKADMYDHFGSSDVKTSATELFSGFDGGAPPQGEYLYQRNGMATLNGITKLDSVTTFKVNADYSYHRHTHDISQSSTYLASDGSHVTVSEQTAPLAETHWPRLSMNYERNADRRYLQETLVAKGKFQRNDGHILGNRKRIGQKRETSSFEVSDGLFWTDMTRKGTRRHLDASVSFLRTPMLRMSFLNDGQSYGQTAQSSTLSMKVGSSFSIPVGKVFRISMPVSIGARHDDLETNRTATGEVNAIHGWSLTPNLNPGFEIHSRNHRLYADFGVGAMLKGLYYNKLNYTKPVLNPSFSMSYTFSANSKLSFNTRYNTNIGDMMALLTEAMQVDYRSVRTSSGIIGEENNWGTSAGWKWQRPMQYFTLSLSANHNEGKRNTLYSQQVEGIDISNSALIRDTRSRSTDFSVSSTKNIPTLCAKLGADANCGFGEGEQAVREQVFKLRNRYYNLHGSASVTPLWWLEMRYDIRYGWSYSAYGEQENSVTSFSHDGELHVFPTSVLDISAHFSHVRRQITTDRYKNMALFNASAQYKFRRFIFRLELDNILNQRSYTYTVFDGINTYSYEYGLCGRTAMVKATFKL